MPDRSDVFAAIADPTRRALLGRLTGGELAVGELAADFAVSRPAISQHLAVLRSAGLVAERRDGRHRRYRLTGAPLAEVDGWVHRYERFWSSRLVRLGGVLNTLAAADGDDPR